MRMHTQRNKSAYATAKHGDIERSHRHAWPMLCNQRVLGWSLVSADMKKVSVWLKWFLLEENKPSDGMITCGNVLLVHDNTQEYIK